MSSMSSVQCHRCFGLHRARATRAQSMWCAGGLVTGRAHLRSQRIRARSQCPPRPCSSACSVAEKRHCGQRAERRCRPASRLALLSSLATSERSGGPPRGGPAIDEVPNAHVRTAPARAGAREPHPLVPVRANRTRQCPCVVVPLCSGAAEGRGLSTVARGAQAARLERLRSAELRCTAGREARRVRKPRAGRAPDRGPGAVCCSHRPHEARRRPGRVVPVSKTCAIM